MNAFIQLNGIEWQTSTTVSARYWARSRGTDKEKV